MAKLPLEGIRVIDLTLVWAGPYGTQLLADWGAEVIRVESIQTWQTNTRGYWARPPDFLVQAGGVLFGYPDHNPKPRPWNRHPIFNCHARNKLSMTVDLKKPQGMEIFRRLISVSDVFAENNATETMDKLGISYEMLREVKPDIIVARMPGYGITGPYSAFRAYGAHLEGACGHTWIRGYRDGDPRTTSNVFHCDATGGTTLAFTILAALHYRKRTGKGQLIDIAQAETLMPQLGEAIMDYTMNGRVWAPQGNRDWHGAAPSGCYRCKGDDRWVTITITSCDEWQGLCRAMGNPHWTEDERFADSFSRWRNQDELDRCIEEWTIQHDNYAVMHMLQREGVPSGAVLDNRDVFKDPHVKERGFFEELTGHEIEPGTGPEFGTHLYPGMSWKMSQTPNAIRTPPCCLGEHNEYVYKQILKVSDEEYADLEKEGHIGTDFVPEIS